MAQLAPPIAGLFVTVPAPFILAAGRSP